MTWQNGIRLARIENPLLLLFSTFKRCEKYFCLEKELKASIEKLSQKYLPNQIKSIGIGSKMVDAVLNDFSTRLKASRK